MKDSAATEPKALNANAPFARPSGMDEIYERMRVAHILHQFEHCAQCGGKLNFGTKTDWVRYEVIENVSCNVCHANAPARMYKLC